VGEDLYLGWFGARRSDLPTGTFTPRPAAGDLPFTVEVVQRSQEGITALRFRFLQPLADSGYRFFVGAPYRTMRPWSPNETIPTAPAEHLRVLNSRLRRIQIAVDIITGWMDRLP